MTIILCLVINVLWNLTIAATIELNAWKCMIRPSWAYDALIKAFCFDKSVLNQLFNVVHICYIKLDKNILDVHLWNFHHMFKLMVFIFFLSQSIMKAIQVLTFKNVLLNHIQKLINKKFIFFIQIIHNWNGLFLLNDFFLCVFYVFM